MIIVDKDDNELETEELNTRKILRIYIDNGSVDLTLENSIKLRDYLNEWILTHS